MGGRKVNFRVMLEKQAVKVIQREDKAQEMIDREAQNPILERLRQMSYYLRTLNPE